MENSKVDTEVTNKPIELTKAQKEELKRQSRAKQIQEQQQYELWKKRLKAEIDDNELKIRWLKSRDELQELDRKYNNEKETELKRIRWIIDEIVKIFNLMDKKDEMYKHFEIPLPKVVENIETNENTKISK
jgi:hypothetical protein